MDLEGALSKLGTKLRDVTHFYKAAASMTFWWDNYFAKPRMLRHLVGQDNILEYKGRSNVVLLFQDSDRLVDMFILLAAARLAGCKIFCGASLSSTAASFVKGR